MLINLFVGLTLFLDAVPATPIIREPARENQVVGASDVHMEAAPMSHSDPARTHASTDWEILSGTERELVWSASAASGLSKNHIHLGDGAFAGSHAGRTDLLFNMSYYLRVRFRDDHDVLSDFAERRFLTGNAFEVYGLEIHDIVPEPAATWRDESGADIVIAANCALRAENGAGQRFFEWTAGRFDDAPPLNEHHVLRIRLLAGDTGWSLPASRVMFHTDDDEVTLYLPALTLTPRQLQTLWISSNGSTYWPESETNPTFGYFNLARSNPVPWRPRDGYRVEPFARDLKMVVNIAMLPNPGAAEDDILCYAVELHGDVKAITRAGTVSTFATGLLNYSPTDPIPGAGEKGLTGIAIDPVTGDVFVGGVYLAPPAAQATDGDFDNSFNSDAPVTRGGTSGGSSGSSDGVFFNRLLRLRSADNGRTATSVETVLDIREPTGAAHQIGAISFFENSLYVSVGDGTTPDTARNLDSFLGKILRLRPDGAPHEDNPYFNLSDGLSARDYIYAIGFRNPFGAAVRSVDGRLYCVENGPATDRLALIERGSDYGWNGYDESMTIHALYNWFPAVAPVNIAFCEPGAFHAGGFPENALHTAFVSEFGPSWAPGTHDRGKRISQFEISASGALISGPTPLIEYTGARLGRSTVSALAFGPGGLYFSDFFKDLDYQGPFDRGSNIFRVVFIGEHGHDAPAPTLTVTCPDNFSIPAEDDSGATIEYGSDVIVEGAIGDVTLRYEPPAGVRLPVGEHDVTVHAVDSTFAAGQCRFTVTISPGKPDIDSSADQPGTNEPGSTASPQTGDGVCPVV
ncbi:MAG: PQQ-dependent sugar dehydrogenase, partial [Phycisphaerales bacterium]|nr:PQQ-dependent sugar dehydrogenase [Phycisphaerales bacterium]